MSALNRPIKSLPCRDATGQSVQVAVSVVPMSRVLVKLWAKFVQPLVDLNYQHTGTGIPDQKIRADVGWNWQHNHDWAAAHGMFLGPTRAMCVVIKQVGAPEFPIGMLTMVPRLNCNAFGVVRERGFSWYLSDAPFEVYQQVLKIPPVRGVASALLDCSIQSTLDIAGDGTHLLHADPRGGDKLIRFYRDTCRMVQLPPTNGSVTKVFRRQDDPEEYFHFDDAQARTYSAKYDPRR